MTFETVNHLFDRVKDFHQQAAKFYRNLSKHVQNDRLQLLFDYLSDEEEGSAESIDKFQKDVDPKILRTGYQFAPHERFDDEMLKQPVDENLTLEEACELIMEIDAVAIELYGQVAQGTILPTDVNDMFSVLAEQQANQRNQHIRDALKTGDM